MRGPGLHILLKMDRVVTMVRTEKGFTLIELMIVVAIIGILASLATSAYQTYSVRAQVTEGLNLAGNAKVPVVDSFLIRGEAPTNRTQAGMTPNATDTQGSYVSSVEIVDGRVDVTFGNRANASIAGQTLSLTPYETVGTDVVWRCGNANAPAGLNPMGTAGGGNVSAYAASTVDNRYLPASCRP